MKYNANKKFEKVTNLFTTSLSNICNKINLNRDIIIIYCTTAKNAVLNKNYPSKTLVENKLAYLEKSLVPD